MLDIEKLMREGKSLDEIGKMVTDAMNAAQTKIDAERIAAEKKAKAAEEARKASKRKTDAREAAVAALADYFTLVLPNGKEIDIYLPDFKFYRAETAKRFAKAPTYPTVARAAIAEMVRQRPTPIIENGIMKSGVIVRILLLPSHLAEAKLSVKYLYSTYGDSIYLSLMNQYTPMPNMDKPLNRRVTREEYDELVDYAARLGVTNCFIQEGATAKESFIPDFDNTGVE